MTQTSRKVRNIYATAIDGATRLTAGTGTLPALEVLAAEIDVPPAQLRQLFGDQAGLAAAMMENAMLLLHHTFIAEVTQIPPDDPQGQFLALARAYVEWGRRYPREFRIIGAMPAAQFECSTQLLRYETSIHELMAKVLTRARDRDLLAGGQDLQRLISIAHVFAYGVVSKMLLGDLARWNPGLTDEEAAIENLNAMIGMFFRPRS